MKAKVEYLYSTNRPPALPKTTTLTYYTEPFLLNDLAKDRVLRFIHDKCESIEADNNKALSQLQARILNNVIEATIRRGKLFIHAKIKDMACGSKRVKGDKPTTRIKPSYSTPRSVSRTLEQLVNAGLLTRIEYNHVDKWNRPTKKHLIGPNLSGFEPTCDASFMAFDIIKNESLMLINMLENDLQNRTPESAFAKNDLQNRTPESAFATIYNIYYTSRINKKPTRSSARTPKTCKKQSLKNFKLKTSSVRLEPSLTDNFVNLHNSVPVNLEKKVEGVVDLKEFLKKGVIPTARYDAVPSGSTQASESQLSGTPTSKKLKQAIHEAWRSFSPTSPPVINNTDLAIMKKVFFNDHLFKTAEELKQALIRVYSEWDIFIDPVAAWAESKSTSFPLSKNPVADKRLKSYARFIHGYVTKDESKKHLASIRALAGNEEALIAALKNKGMDEKKAVSVAKRMQRRAGIEDLQNKAETMIGRAQEAILQAKAAERNAAYGAPAREISYNQPPRSGTLTTTASLMDEESFYNRLKTIPSVNRSLWESMFVLNFKDTDNSSSFLNEAARYHARAILNGQLSIERSLFASYHQLLGVWESDPVLQYEGVELRNLSDADHQIWVEDLVKTFSQFPIPRADKTLSRIRDGDVLYTEICEDVIHQVYKDFNLAAHIAFVANSHKNLQENYILSLLNATLEKLNKCREKTPLPLMQK